MQVVLEGHADAAVELHAVLHSSAPYSPMNALAALTSSPASARPSADGRRGRVADGVAGLEPRLHVGEAVLERLVRGERPAERVAVERPLDGHVERASASRRPTRRRGSRAPAAAGARRPRRRLPDLADHRARPAPARRRSVTTENRRVRSTVCIGVDREPGASVGTSTWVSPSPVRPVTSRWLAASADSTGRLTPLSTRSSPSTRTSSSTRAEPIVRRPARRRHHDAIDVAGEQRREQRRASASCRSAAAATTLVGSSGPGAAWRPNSWATSVRSTRPLPADRAAPGFPPRAATSSRARRPAASSRRRNPAGRRAGGAAPPEVRTRRGTSRWSPGRTPGQDRDPSAPNEHIGGCVTDDIPV